MNPNNPPNNPLDPSFPRRRESSCTNSTRSGQYLGSVKLRGGLLNQLDSRRSLPSNVFIGGGNDVVSGLVDTPA